MEENELSIFPERVVVYASFWERFAAAFLDGLIVSAVTYPMYYFVFGSLTQPGVSANLVGVIIAWLYEALQESGPAQATLGKRAMGIKVTDMNGLRISFGRATGRHFGKIISFVILLIGYLMVLWDDKKQALHDKMAGTFVVLNK